MATTGPVTMRAELLECAEGLWCAACAAPTVVRMTIAATLGQRLTLTTRARCTRCGLQGRCR